jgi:hypothetical protein
MFSNARQLAVLTSRITARRARTLSVRRIAASSTTALFVLPVRGNRHGVGSAVGWQGSGELGRRPPERLHLQCIVSLPPQYSSQNDLTVRQDQRGQNGRQ